MIQTVTVTPTGAQIASGGEWTVVNNDLFTALTVATTSDFNVITTVSIPPLTAGSFDGPLYAKAASDISVSVIPKAQGYMPGSVVAVNTSDTYSVPSFDVTGGVSGVSVVLFTAPRVLTLQYISGTVYVENTYNASSPTSYTFETSNGLILASGTNWSAGYLVFTANNVSIRGLSSYNMTVGQTIELLCNIPGNSGVEIKSSNLVIGYQ